MTAIPSTELESMFLEAKFLESTSVVAVPILLKGQIVRPPRLDPAALASAARSLGVDGDTGPRWFTVEGAQVLRQPLRARDGQTGDQFLVLPRVDPRALIEDDLSALARGLYALPFAEVAAYLGAVRDTLRASRDALANAAAAARRAEGVGDERLLALLFDMLPELLDPDALAEAVDRELAGPEAAGRAYLDGWVEVRAATTRGVTARLSDRMHRSTRDDVAVVPRVRATPTRQLHITAGNSPVIPVLSWLRALASKGAAVIKGPAEATVVTAVLGMAMRAVDPDHPITRHTSLVYWKGGDRAVEDVLFAPGAFDRLVVWGSPETVDSVQRRAPGCKTVFFNPRYGMSLIGQAAFPDHVEVVAQRGAADSMIGNQAACSASLVHYVEGSEDQALVYCQALQAALAAWDRGMPHRLSRPALGRLRLLRRGPLVGGVWLCNEQDGELRSAVVYMPEPFDVSLHPMGRCIVVRRVDRLADALEFIGSAVSTVGVYPEEARLAVRDALAAAGVSNVMSLGDCERAWPGMPHDGMRVLGELVHWTCA